MKNIAIVGGMASGKTTLADSLIKEDPSMHFLRMSDYCARIPMTLVASTHPCLLALPESRYIQAILENQDIQLSNLKGQRQKMDEFEKKILSIYGQDIFGKIALSALALDVQNLADNIILVPNVRYLKDRGFYIVGCSCDFEVRVERCLSRGKDIDPINKSDLEMQIRNTDAFFEADKTIRLADAVYDTTRISLESYTQIARTILEITR